MIAVRIPKEIKAYKEKIALGLSLRQLIASIIAVIICIPLYWWGIKIFNEELISWVVMFIALPVIAFGFFKINGMNFEKFIVVIFKQYFLFPNKRIFKSFNFFRTLQNEYDKSMKKPSKKDLRKKYKNSLEKCFLIEEANKSNQEIDIDRLDEEFKFNNNNNNNNKHNDNKKPKKEKKDKNNKKLTLEIQVEEIKNKQANDPYYLITKKERRILNKYINLKEKQRKKEIANGKKEIEKKNKQLEKRRKLRATTIPRTTQDTIPYIADYEEGLFEVEKNKYSKSYEIRDINYLVAKQEEQINIFVKYGEFLNYFAEDMNISITIDNRVVSLKEQEEKIFYSLKGDHLDVHRNEYNRILKRQLIAGRNDIQQNKYITVTINADTPYEAILRFHKIDNEIRTNLRKIGSDARLLSTDERLELLHDKFRRGREGEFKINFDFLKNQGLSSKDYIAPSSFLFKKNYLMIEEEYYSCLYLNNLPASLSDEFLSELTDCEFPLITTLNIQPVSQDKGLKIVKRQLTGMEANKIEAEKKAMRAGYSPETISHDLKQSLKQAEELLDDMMNKDQKMFFVTISLMVHGETLDDLEEHIKILISKARKYTCQLQRFDFQQEDAFKITLPLGVSPKKVSVERTLTTESTSIFIPFSSEELYQAGGFYYGLNQISRNLILCDRTNMKTPSGFILGSSGSGKSFATKREILNVLLNDDKTNVLVIDPENEYSDFARAFGGTVVSISTDSNNYINPLDMSMDYGLDDGDDNVDLISKKTKALQKKSDYLMSIIQYMITVGNSTQSTITPVQKTIVDRSIREAYKEFMDNNFDQKYLPTLLTLQEKLDREKKESEEGRIIAEGVEYYTKGSMNIFSHKTNVEINNRFVVFNVRDLGTQLKQIALLIVLDFIWNRMISNFQSGIRTYCYVDEIHVLFQNEYSARFLQQLYKRGRKYGLVMTGITQNMEDLFNSEMAKGMIGNSDFIMMLSQAPEDLKILSPMLNISNAQMSYVNRVDAGSGLLFAESVIVPFMDSFPKDSYLYKLMSTKFGENDNIKEIVENAIKKYGELEI